MTDIPTMATAAPTDASRANTAMPNAEEPDPDREAAIDAAITEQRLTQLRRLMLVLLPLAIVIQQGWALMDKAANDPRASQWLVIRAVSSAIVAILLAYTYLNKHGRWMVYVPIAAAMVIQTSTFTALPFSNDKAFYDRIFVIGLMVFALAVSTPVHWKYTALLNTSTLTGLVITLLVSTQSVGRILISVFFLSNIAIFSIYSNYHRYRLANQEFRSRLAAQQALADAEAEHAKNTELMEYMAQLTREDPLTGISNRRALDEFLQREIAESQVTDAHVGFIMLDIDFFKRLNDTHGHRIGDKVLREVTNGLREAIEPGDFIARYGGEEFVVVVPHAKPEQFAAKVEHIRTALWHPDPRGEFSAVADLLQPQAVTLSAGGALYPTNAATCDLLIERADQALYVAKNSGRNCSSLSDANVPAAEAKIRNLAPAGKPKKQTKTIATNAPQTPTLTHPLSMKKLRKEHDRNIMETLRNQVYYITLIGAPLYVLWIPIDYFQRPWDLAAAGVMCGGGFLGSTLVTSFSMDHGILKSRAALGFACFYSMAMLPLWMTSKFPYFQYSINGDLMAMLIPILAGPILYVWHWRYSVYLVSAATISTVVFSVTAITPIPHADLMRILFYLLFGGIFAIVGHYVRYTTAWKDFVSRKTLEHATEETKAQRSKNDKIVIQLSEITRLDSLTEVANRRAFDEFLEREIAETQRTGHSLGLIMLDIDHFKKINDTFGHRAGDEVLRRVAGALRESLEGGEFLARYGGEEFVVVIPHINPVLLAEHTERIRTQASRAFGSENTLPLEESSSFTLESLTMSAGAALYPTHGQDQDSLVIAADRALYQSKSAGRDCHTIAGGQGPLARIPRQAAAHQSQPV